MRKLSRLRRHRFASPLLLVAALIVLGTTYSVAATSTQTTQMSSATSTQIDEGKSIFARG